MFATLFGSPSEVDDAADKNLRVVWLWPENVQAWHHWCEVQTQWNVGMGGATGLDYAGVRAYLQISVPKRKARTEVFEGIRAAERATLEVWDQQRKDRNRD